MSASPVFSVYSERSSAKVWWFKSGAFLTITSESQGDVTRDSLKVVTWSHGTHDVRDMSGRSDGSRMRKQHQKGFKTYDHVRAGSFTAVVPNKHRVILYRSLVDST